jgi:hypothetical protein
LSDEEEAEKMMGCDANIDEEAMKVPQVRLDSPIMYQNAIKKNNGSK